MRVRAIPEAASPTIGDAPLLLPLTRARTDDEIVAAWLARPNLSPRTVRGNRKEAGRFLLWCRAREVPLRRIAVEDLFHYSAFLMMPAPAADWIAATRWRRDDPRWRPFCGPLSDGSHRQALVIIKGLFSWAYAAGYLAADPAALLGRLGTPAAETVSRFLPPIAISILMEAADRIATATRGGALRRARARFLVQAFYLTGARLSELAGADMGSMRQDDAGAWWLHVLGKGNKSGKIPVAADLLAEFQRYRLAFALAALPAPRDATPLVLTTVGDSRRATHYAVAKAMKALMRSAAALASELGLPHAADRIALASTHWLRHSSVTHQIDAGVPLKTVQRNARHASLNTTSRYIHKEDAQRHAETVAALKIRPL
ncbi:integrase/recombinase XerD [Oxalobacteraceae bacterium GrIS 1.11]